MKGILICIVFFALFFNTNMAISTTISIKEVLTIKTGNKNDAIANQFIETTLEPYNGFAIDSTKNIFISDTLKNRVLRFSKEGFFELTNQGSSFFPESLCLIDNSIYVHNLEKQEVVIFSENGKVLKSYNPSAALENAFKKIQILSLTCNKTTFKVAFELINKTKHRTRLVYQDTYDQNLNIIERKIFQNQAAYYSSLEKDNAFVPYFEDLHGNLYGYPIIREWYGKFLPLQKYSPKGDLLFTIDGKLLTNYLEYNVYDYYTARNINWLVLKGKDFLIVNWYVDTFGVVYALLANQDYLKVIQIDIKT